MIPENMALRRRMMGSRQKLPFAYTYSGKSTGSLDAEGKGTLKLTSSGTLTVLSGEITVQAYILAGGGGSSAGGASSTSGDFYYAAAGGGGGNETITVALAEGETYSVEIGSGGIRASAGKNTSAFGVTCTGGGGGSVSRPGSRGTPNGTAGQYKRTTSSNTEISASGGSPNGGDASRSSGGTYRTESGGDGYVELSGV